MAIDAWVGSVAGAAITALGAYALKMRGDKNSKDLSDRKDESTSLGEVSKTLETAFDKSETRREKQFEEYKQVLSEVADLKTQVALNVRDIAALTALVQDLKGEVLDGRTKLTACEEEKQALLARAHKAEADAESYRISMESFALMLEASNGAKVDNGLMLIANDAAGSGLRASQTKDKSP